MSTQTCSLIDRKPLHVVDTDQEEPSLRVMENDKKPVLKLLEQGPGKMRREFCPNCRLLREMNEFTSTRTNFYRDGATKDVQIRVFSCAACNQFVMSEDAEAVPAGNTPDHKAGATAPG